REIFERTIDRSLIGARLDANSVQRSAGRFAELLGRKSIRHLVHWVGSVVDLSPTLESLSFLSIFDTIVCIDDLERKGATLDLRDVMGLVSLLREQRRCKVVLILND